MSEKVITVSGPISPDDLGIVLPHEHLMWDQLCWVHEEPPELQEREQYRQKISLKNRGKVIYHAFNYRDNLFQTDLNIAISEVTKFKMAGGRTICDVTTRSLGRDPEALSKISITAGLNVIMGCGNYIADSWSEEEKKLTEEEIKNGILYEFENGAGTTGIKPGILGEVGISDIANPIEIKNLRASGMAQRELGCPMIIHTPIWKKEGNTILDILEDTVVDMNKIALSHLDPTMSDYDYADSLAQRGAYIVYDQFGMHLMTYEGWFLPSDNDRIKTIKEQIDRGNLKHILISQDVCFKILLTQWGGHGYAHIIENIVPRLRKTGITEEQIHTILVENPKRFLSW